MTPDLSKLSPWARAEVERQLAAAPKKTWSGAVAAERDGITFASKTEAGVYDRLLAEFGRPAIRTQIRMPLLAGVRDGGRVLYLTVDFVVYRPSAPVPILYVDAKTRRKSRDWARGKSLFEATWGKLWEWDGRGDPPWSGQ